MLSCRQDNNNVCCIVRFLMRIAYISVCASNIDTKHYPCHLLQYDPNMLHSYTGFCISVILSFLAYR